MVVLLLMEVTSILTPYAEMVLQRRMQKSISSPLPAYIYLVSNFKTTCVVDLNGHTYSCGKWRSLGIACGHAIASTRYSNMHELVDTVQVFYHTDVFKLVYQTQTVHPVPPPSEWEIPDPLMVVLLPM
uniref:SWIM-type domain-containing protein n=1 Tax=Lactuca sativa TaxID=4236 RepID=A0A9R1WI55_LACSA|nr:hypothetical protein LSAT_V11C200061480 [Lactuca sativa]